MNKGDVYIFRAYKGYSFRIIEIGNTTVDYKWISGHSNTVYGANKSSLQKTVDMLYIKISKEARIKKLLDAVDNAL